MNGQGFGSCRHVDAAPAKHFTDAQIPHRLAGPRNTPPSLAVGSSHADDRLCRPLS
jgi:hypothetical protein